MAKLTGAKKKAFLERMAKGRRKAARANPKKNATKKRKPAAKKAKKNPTVRKSKAKRKAHRGGGASQKNPKYTIFGGSKKRGTGVIVHAGIHAKTAAEALRKFHESTGHIYSSDARLHAVREKNEPHHNPARKKRRNSSAAAEASAMFKTFHQMPPNRIIDYEELVKYPSHFAEIGLPLKELRVFLDEANPDFAFTRFGDCQVVCTPDGTNIYFVGGDQEIDLEALDISSDKDTIELGPCTYICYHTIKGFHDFEPINYYHNFGEEDQVFPRLGYDRINKRLFLIGGNYQVKREGIVN